MNPLFDLGYKDDDLSVKVSELLVATADEADEQIDQSVPQVLRLLRERMNMDIVFVSEFTDGKRVFRHVDAASEDPIIAAGGADPLEASWCQRVVDGRLPGFIADAAKNPASKALEAQLPFRIGTHISSPIVLKSGEVYGTLCCFSFSPQDNPNPQDLRRLQYTAQLTADKIDRSRSNSAANASETRASDSNQASASRFGSLSVFPAKPPPDDWALQPKR